MSYKIISKFIKDISFEIPNAETFVLLEKEIEKYNLIFDIKSKPFKNNIVEVNTIMKLVPREDIKHKMLVEINLAALVSLDYEKIKKVKIEKEDFKFKETKQVEKIILSDVPQEVYPTLYETFIFLFSKAGIKNINVTKEVNFEKLYNERGKSQLK